MQDMEFAVKHPGIATVRGAFKEFELHFESTEIRPLGEDTFDIEGDRTTRGVTHPIVLRAEFQGQAAAGPRVPPPRHKMAVLTWVGAWALITLILWVLGPVMVPWPLPLRTLVLSALMVLGMTWLVIPYLTRIFAGWLAPTPPAAYRQHRDHGGRHRPSRPLSVPC